MNRNRHPIRHTDQVLNAARAVDQITKALKMSKADFDDMFNVDVYSRIDPDLSMPDQAALRAFAEGVHMTYLTIILTEHCEFVYLVDGVILGVKEVVRQGAGGREGSTCGHQWKDSDFPFTEFAKEIPSWI